MKQKLLKGLFFIAVFLLLGAAFMFLWNKLLPAIAHTGAITYWQALGLIVLSRILFGKFSFGGWMGQRGAKESPYLFKDKMADEDGGVRDAFKDEWKKRCAKHGRS